MTTSSRITTAGIITAGGIAALTYYTASQPRPTAATQTATYTWSFDTTTVPDGYYNVTVVATDPSGNRSSPANAVYRVNNVPTTQPPDIDNDDKVDQEDVTAFLRCASGPARPYGPGCSVCDFDGDGDVDLSDFGILQAALGRGVAPPVNVH